MATLFLMVGLPGAGKSTRAKELAAEQGALRLSPDAWMIPLFGESEAGEKRDVLEGRLIWVALETLKQGTSVVLDFGFWSRDKRSALRWLATSAHLRGPSWSGVGHRIRVGVGIAGLADGGGTAEVVKQFEHFVR